MERSDRASSKEYIVRWVEAPSNKLLTTAFEASLEPVTVTRRLSVDKRMCWKINEGESIFSPARAV